MFEGEGIKNALPFSNGSGRARMSLLLASVDHSFLTSLPSGREEAITSFVTRITPEPHPSVELHGATGQRLTGCW